MISILIKESVVVCVCVSVWLFAMNTKIYCIRVAQNWSEGSRKLLLMHLRIRIRCFWPKVTKPLGPVKIERHIRKVLTLTLQMPQRIRKNIVVSPFKNQNGSFFPKIVSPFMSTLLRGTILEVPSKKSMFLYQKTVSNRWCNLFLNNVNFNIFKHTNERRSLRVIRKRYFS